MNDKNGLSQTNYDHVKNFESLLDQYESKIFRLIVGLIGHTPDAEDLTQEVFVKVYQKLHTFKGNSSLATWINKIAINHTRNFLRRKKLVKFLSLDWLKESQNQEFQDTSSFSNLESTIEQNERNEYVHRALNTLNTKHKELIILSELNDLNYKELAGILELPIGTIKSRLSRAKIQLKTTLKNMEALNERP